MTFANFGPRISENISEMSDRRRNNKQVWVHRVLIDPADLEPRIAHLLLTDVVGYSKLLINEQIELLKELKSGGQAVGDPQPPALTLHP